MHSPEKLHSLWVSKSPRTIMPVAKESSALLTVYSNHQLLPIKYLSS